MDEASDQVAPRRLSIARRLAAVMLPPLVLAPFIVLTSWHEVVHAYSSSSGAATYWVALGALGLPYLLGAPAGALTLALASTFKAPNHAWAMVPLYVAVCLPVLIIVSGLNGGGGDLAVPALLYGTPMGIVFCLILGSRWR